MSRKLGACHSSDYAIKNDKTAEVKIQNGYMYLRKSQLIGSERFSDEYESKITPVEISGVTYIAGLAMNETGLYFPKMHHFYFMPQTKMFYFDDGVYLDFDRKTVGHGGISEYRCN